MVFNFNTFSERWKYIKPDQDSENKEHILIDLKHKDKIKFNLKTAHVSKGLESDIVIILNTKNDVLGFPSKVDSDYLLEYFLKSEDIYPYEEERRLFYVSLTRAKKELYLFVPHENQSSFMHEILEDNNIILKKSDKVLNTVYCSKCHAEMKLRTNEYGIEFYGCSNYPNCTHIKSKNQKQNIVCCPICQSEMSIRVNKKGEKFYGCSNYPKCKGTRSI